ncbi:MAG TPA: GNAT family N-acetyltransferase [Pyrinomonadaceae bacterium]|jgi:ribosomal protein S18 acetylase RimI-like enzyme
MESRLTKRPPAVDATASVTLRAAGADDEPFLFEVYRSTRAAEMAAWGWGEAQQDAFLRLQFTAQRLAYGAQFPDAEQMIILEGEHLIGRMLIDRRDEEIYLVDITILVEHRGAGTGTSLMRELQREAAAASKPVRLRVMKTNRAVRFYERLGFSKIDENATHFQMEWLPGA